jgi:seryl-tRNA synthetase
MIDVKALRENPDLVRASQKARGENPDLVDQALAADEKRRNAIVEFEALRAEQNTLSKSVGAAKGDEKAALLEKAKALSAAVKEAESKKNGTEADFKKIAMEISNLVDTSAPVGGEADFKVI